LFLSIHKSAFLKYGQRFCYIYITVIYGIQFKGERGELGKVF
jgi:hypothetical protein